MFSIYGGTDKGGIALKLQDWSARIKKMKQIHKMLTNIPNLGFPPYLYLGRWPGFASGRGMNRRWPVKDRTVNYDLNDGIIANR